MKPIILAAAFLLAGTAFAQEAETPQSTDAESEAAEAEDAEATEEAAPAETTTTTTTTTTTATHHSSTAVHVAQPAGGQAVAPGNTAPERDARGIPVISAPAATPPGWNQAPSIGGTGASPSAPAAPMGSAGPLPPCSRTVTDRCTQTYERGVRAPG